MANVFNWFLFNDALICFNCYLGIDTRSSFHPLIEWWPGYPAGRGLRGSRSMILLSGPSHIRKPARCWGLVFGTR